MSPLEKVERNAITLKGEAIEPPTKNAEDDV